MTEMARELRQSFLNEIAHSAKIGPRTFFARGDRRGDGSTVNYITVVLGLDWPTHLGKPLGPNAVFQSSEMLSLCGAIFRIKNFLESSLLERVDLLDIRAGCVRVRYRVPDAVSPYAVADAITALRDNGASYDVISVEGHVSGRALKI
jgi:hypothetical protein